MGGIVNWLLAMAMQVLIPRGDFPVRERNASSGFSLFAGSADRLLALASANAIVALVILMLAFYNKHMNFYHNYFEMVCRLGQLTFKRFFTQWPPRLMPFL